MKEIYVNELVTDKKDAKFIEKDVSETFANNVRNQLPQPMVCVIYM